MILDAKLYQDIELYLLRTLYDREEVLPCKDIAAGVIATIETRFDLVKKEL